MYIVNLVMEKFRKFADDATGNHPFLANPNHKASPLGLIVGYVVNPL